MKAYITLLSTDSYCDGVLVLNRALREVGAGYPLYCALSPGVSEAAEYKLVQKGILCIRLTGSALSEDVNATGKVYSNWNYTFDKFRIWGLTQFEKLVFLDSDMLIRRNLDFLFDCKPFSGTCAGKSVRGHEKWAGINSGLMVVVPDPKVETALVELMPSVVEDYKKKGLSVGDQDVLQRYLTGWDDKTELHLDEGFNVFADYLTYYIRHLGYSWNDRKGKSIAVVHFIGRLKPWMSPTLRNRLWLWWMCVKNPYYFLAYRKFRSYL